jgi:2-iminobutanoate/2-iminopropanoate deaminase
MERSVKKAGSTCVGCVSMSHHRETVTAVGAPKAAGPYSHAVKSGGLIFLSGQTPIDPDTGGLVEGGIGPQTKRCLDNLAIVAAAAGASLTDAVRCGIYVTDMATFKDVNEAYGAYFQDDPPARSTIGVAALPLGAHVEIDMVLALPD